MIWRAWVSISLIATAFALTMSALNLHVLNKDLKDLDAKVKVLAEEISKL